MRRAAAPQIQFFSRRWLSTSLPRLTSWSPGPAPPRLPKEEQEIFEQLQKESTGAFSTPRQPPKVNQSPQNQLEDHSDMQPSQVRATPTMNQSPDSSSSEATTTEQQLSARLKTGDGEELHPNVRRGAAPEFQGDVNPDTGESGGPKNNPLRWGHEGDWSYNGRVTDF